MQRSRFDQVLDYFPILAYFGFWIQGAAISSIITGEPRLMALGIVTAPAIAAMTAAILKLRGRQKEDNRLGLKG